MSDELEGISRGGITAWLAERVPHLHLPLAFELVAGGRSNLTYRISERAGRAWILRRPPLHSVLASAHDVVREYRIMDGLARTPVPVPRMVGFCEDPAVIGAAFYVMDFVRGNVIRDAETAQRYLPIQSRREVALNLVDTLAELHAVDPESIGLGDLGRRGDYVSRQLRRWFRQFEQVKTRDLPLIVELHARLAAHIPNQARRSIVHGDYRLDNCIVDGTEIRAVLDWELCTLGDPLTDLGALLTSWADPSADRQAFLAGPTTVEGMPSRTEIAQRYAASSGAGISSLDYYVAFASWRLAVTLEGVWSRFISGAYGSSDEANFQFKDEVPWLAERAHEAATRAGI